ncbi:MAG TPA: metal-dependent hydrolase [Pirellulaceae bacterium]|nr:metal-dependent hydrolase [Pirellulaceae bacterium]
MTTPEHTLVGIHTAFALGVHRRFGWPAVTMAGVASNVPDLDGLPMLLDMQRFEAGHRVWGHNVLAILISSVLLGWSQSKYHWIERLWKLVQRMLSIPQGTAIPDSRSVAAIAIVGIAFFAQTIHLPCDMVVSGGHGLSDWPIQPLWPFSGTEFVFPLIPWGDIGPTVILMAGIIWIAKRPTNLSTISVCTLIALTFYLVARGWSRGMFLG